MPPTVPHHPLAEAGEARYSQSGACACYAAFFVEAASTKTLLVVRPDLPDDIEICPIGLDHDKFAHTG